MLLYRIILLLLTPVIFLHLLWRALQCGEWRYFAQRIGLEYDDVPQAAVWVHCASVGEVKCVLPLLHTLHEQDPDIHFLITSNTATSRRIVLQQQADWITHLYCPIDWRLAVNSFLAHASPRCCYLFETELWPNLIDRCAERSIAVRIINGRISDNSMRRAGLLRHIYRKPLTSLSSIHTRNNSDRERFIALGADEITTSVSGDLKLAYSNSSTLPPQQFTTRDYILLVSTHEDEERRLTEQLSPLLDDHLLVIVPRHPERGSAVANQLHNMGLRIAMHSSHDAITAETDVYIIDAIGQLDAWFPNAAEVIMGGTFADIGGHNLIEPLSHGCAVVYGPSMHNFIEMNQLVLEHSAAIQVQSIEGVCDVLRGWREDSAAKQQLQSAAKELVSSLNSTLSDYTELLSAQLQSPR